MSTHVWKDQINAAGVGGFNQWKETSLNNQLGQVMKDKISEQNLQSQYFENALGHLMKMRGFLSNPQHILGSEQTKHGEVAEHLEVHVRNARETLNGRSIVATFDGVGRTAPEDFLIEGVKHQSKFINGTNNALQHILKHFNKYEDETMNYLIPKDQYKVIEAIKAGNPPNYLSDKYIRNLLQKVEELENRTGRSYHDFVKSSISNYDEVQLGKVGKTVSNYQNEIVEENQKIQDEIFEDAKRKTKMLEIKRAPSVGEGAKIAGSAAAIAASLNTITVIYSKVKKGKKIQDFNEDDWKDIGLSSAKAGVKGGVTAGSIYTLTNLTSLSAPFAGAAASAAMGLASLRADLREDQISMDEFVTAGQILCIEAGIAATGGAIGQMLIPVPVLGAIIGTVTANFVWGFAKDKIDGKERELKKFLDTYTDSLLAKVDQAYQEIISQINATYNRYDTLIEAAFDVQANSAVLASASVILAVELGVSNSKILRNDADLDSFFLG